MFEIWLISIMKELCGTLSASVVTTRVKILSVRPIVASAAGTKDLPNIQVPHWGDCSKWLVHAGLEMLLSETSDSKVECYLTQCGPRRLLAPPASHSSFCLRAKWAVIRQLLLI